MYATRIASRGTAIAVAGFGLLTVAVVRAIWFTPVERIQGPAQKIFYVHVPAAWLALLAFTITGVLSVVFLVRGRPRVDLFAAASAEVGVVFSTIVLTTGPLWGRPVWGTWWAWDMRFITMLALFGVFVIYLVLRRTLRDPVLCGEMCAVIGLGGLFLVPLNHLAVMLFRTQHPDPVVLRSGGPALPDAMLLTLLLAWVAYAVLYAGFAMQRYAVGLAAREDGR